VKYTDTRLLGTGWNFDCHALLVLPKHLIPPSLPDFESRLTVYLPDVEKSDVLNYLTYCYTGRFVLLRINSKCIHFTFSLPTNRDAKQGFQVLIKMLWPDGDRNDNHSDHVTVSSGVRNESDLNTAEGPNSSKQEDLFSDNENLGSEDENSDEETNEESDNNQPSNISEDFGGRSSEDLSSPGISLGQRSSMDNNSKRKRARVLMPQRKPSLPDPDIDNFECKVCHRIIKE
jgi:hypothetical protein